MKIAALLFLPGTVAQTSAIVYSGPVAPTATTAVTKRTYSDANCVTMINALTLKTHICVPSATGGSTKITRALVPHPSGLPSPNPDNVVFTSTMYGDAGCATAVGSADQNEGTCTPSGVGMWSQMISFTETVNTLVAGVYTESTCTLASPIGVYLHSEIPNIGASVDGTCDPIWNSGMATGSFKVKPGYEIDIYYPNDVVCASTPLTIGPSGTGACTELKDTTLKAAMGCTDKCYAVVYPVGQATVSSASRSTAAISCLSAAIAVSALLLA